jgi:hypothetical protein
MRRVLMLAVVAVLALAVVVPTVGAKLGRRDSNARTGVALYRLGDAAGEGDVHGLGVIVQRGRVIRWWVSGWGLTAGLHAQHIHGPGPCEANAPIILPLPDLEVAADGSFFASGQTRTNVKIAFGSALNYWNIHASSTQAGVGPGVMCGERERVRITDR